MSQLLSARAASRPLRLLCVKVPAVRSIQSAKISGTVVKQRTSPNGLAAWAGTMRRIPTIIQTKNQATACEVPRNTQGS